MSNNHIKPTIGRIVYYRGKDGDTRAAIIAAVNGDFNVSLFVIPKEITDTEIGHYASVTHADPEVEPGCFPSWHWMPYQKEQAAKQVEAASTAIGGVVGRDYDPAAEQAYIQRHQREQALHPAVSSRGTHADAADILEAAGKFFAFMQDGSVIR